VSEAEFFGETFEIADRVPDLLFMEFADAAEQTGGDAADMMREQAAMFRLIKGCMNDKDWPRFRKLALKHNAGMDDLLDVVHAVFEAKTDRPTSRPADSSAGSLPIEPRSADDSSQRVIARLEASGRPDLALIVSQAQAS
jgi:hypothetical protein